MGHVILRSVTASLPLDCEKVVGSGCSGLLEDGFRCSRIYLRPNLLNTIEFVIVLSIIFQGFFEGVAGLLEPRLPP